MLFPGIICISPLGVGRGGWGDSWGQQAEGKNPAPSEPGGTFARGQAEVQVSRSVGGENEKEEATDAIKTD